MSITVNIAGIDVTFGSYRELIANLYAGLHQKKECITVGYVNANTIVLSREDSELFAALNGFSALLADGAGIHLAARLLHTTVKGLWSNNNATDFNFEMLRYADEHSLRIYFLGTTRVSLDLLQKRITERYSGITVVGCSDGFVDIHDASLPEMINRTKPDILMVGMGSPIQELWVNKHKEDLNVPLTITVGAFLDYVSGYMQRAPMFFRLCRMEWLYRLLIEPRRLWRRYIIGIPKFVYIVLWQKFHR
ncbi:MAG: WecB/TagA/CpsF family glycosyltransferase [Bacteroidota bacterium]